MAAEAANPAEAPRAPVPSADEWAAARSWLETITRDMVGRQHKQSSAVQVTQGQAPAHRTRARTR